MSIRNKVEEIVQTRWNDLKNPTNLLSVYEIEKQTNKGYNGRQLLELFQNCEDEGASTVRISLDTDTRTLKISNDGAKPFSVKGYKSIFYPGLSAKVSSGYIGNKGLGFRSIINWSDEVSIISNDFKVVFNEAFKENILINELGYTKSVLKEIRTERNFKSNVFPIPFLNSCEITDLDLPHSYTTTIEIRYKEDYEEDIVKQLKSISEKTLLFLRNINTIQIEGNVLEKTISVKRRQIDAQHSEISHEGEIFYVLSDDGIVDEGLVKDRESNEPKRYSVKIAYNNDLSFRDEVMYNYFKTQIPFELPFVVHASLELDQNRNHSTESQINDFVLEKLFQLHLLFIEVLKNRLDKSWLPYLTINNDDFDLFRPYSEMIDDYWESFEIYPTLSGKYETLNRAKNLGNGIAKFLKENALEKVCGQQIVHRELNFHLKKTIEKPTNYVELAESIGESLTIQQRARFIKLLLENYPHQKFCILIDEKNYLIGVEEYVYTDKTPENKELEVPGYSNIKFLHSSLYQALIRELELTSETNKSRALKERLEKISDVHSFEPQTVIKKIISETDNFLEKNKNKQEEIIFEFYQKLFHNYQLRKDNPKLEYDSRIPCLNQLNQIKNIRNLVLSKEFKIGQISSEIFDEIYDEEFIISNLATIGLANEDLNEVESFLTWLGVNSFSIIERKTSGIDNKYIDFANREYKTQIFSYNLFSILNFGAITNQHLTINQMIAWLSLDEQLKFIFTNYTSTYSHSEDLKFSHYGVKPIRPFKNFIYYSISRRYEIENYLITNKKTEWFNPFQIDYEYLNRINPQLDKSEVDRILSFFGAKKDFNDLKIEYLKTNTQELANRNKPKGAQVFYKKLVDHFKQNQQKILDVDLYARKGNAIVVKNAQEIYYSDRIQLPEVLTNDFPILYFPSRSGGTRAIEMFGLKNLNELDLKIEKESINESISDEFQNFIQEIVPFVLAFRLDKITKEDVKKDQVQRLNRLKIVCCSELICSLENKNFEIEPYDYIYNHNQFYIRIPSKSSLNDIRQNKKFRDNLSDIFLKVFDTQDEKKTFESIVLQTREDNTYDINNELAEGILEEAKILLGRISIRLSIWKSIFRLKGIPEIDDLNDNNVEKYVLYYFPNIDIKLLFISDENIEQLKRLNKIFEYLDIDLEEYNRESEYKLSFDKLYNRELTNYYNQQTKNLKNQLWFYLSEQDTSAQKQFLHYIYKIEHLLKDFEFRENLGKYDLKKVILIELKKQFPKVKFDLDHYQNLSYDLVEKETKQNFSTDEILKIRKNEYLNSLSHFEGYTEFIQVELAKEKEKSAEKQSDETIFDITQSPELIQDFDLEINLHGSSSQNSSGPWLGDTNDLNPNQKKKLGIKAEEVVEQYLESKPQLYNHVEHISKTSEGEHYDLKYFDVREGRVKYVECKYYNGTSFFLSREEKKFADDHVDQYEIWLVNKNSKIFRIKDITALGDLQPVNYKVNLKVKQYALPS